MPNDLYKTAHVPRYEEEPDNIKKSIRMDSTGISSNWRMILLIAATLLGGGSVFGWKIVPAINGEDNETTQAIRKHEEGPAHTQLNVTLKNQGKQITANTETLNDVSNQLTDVQTTQNSAYARQEARRVTEEIKSRDKREREYDRIVRINFSRLKKGREPCSNIDCSN